MTAVNSARDFNFEWASTLINALVCAGVSTFVISPGARSSALALAAAEQKKSIKKIHFDERGSAFYALGVAKVTQCPVVLLCTSGTAGANYLPAVMEAYNAEAPLIILTADRPPELHNTGANQTIVQTGIFSDYAVWQHALPTPDADSDNTLAMQIAYEAFFHAAQKKGPVHLNCPFREPLVTTGITARLPIDTDCKHPETNFPKALPDTHQIAELLKQSTRGVIVVGTLPPETDVRILQNFIRMLNWPCFCDITSQLRFGSVADDMPLCTTYDSYLRNHTAQSTLVPDCVLRIGTTVTSKYLEKYLAGCTGEYIQLQSGRRTHDPERSVTKTFHGDSEQILSALTELLPFPVSSLRTAVLEYEAEARQRISATMEKSTQNLQWSIAFQALTLPDLPRVFFIGNSLCIREADATCPVMTLSHKLCANRGVSGIDGLIATAVGIGEGANSPTTMLIGDLSALHDLNSLALVAQASVPFIIIIINNDGGAIFSLHPAVKNSPVLTEYFVTPHGLSFAHAAKLFNLDYKAVPEGIDFDKIYRAALHSNKSVILEVFFNAECALESLSRLHFN